VWWNSAVESPDVSLGTGPGPTVPASTRSRPRSVRRGLTAAAWTLGTVAGFVAYLRLSWTLPVNSDGASQALMAWDMLHGNVLLHGWTMGDVTYYTTELPEYMLVEAVRGLNQGALHAAAALTYTLAVLLAALLAKGPSTGREAVARLLIAVGIMLAPQLGAGTLTLLSSPDHFGTSVPVLLAWVIVDRAGARWYVPVVIALLLGWAEVADPTVFFIGVLPLVVVCAVRVGRAMASGGRLAQQWYEIALGAGAVAGAAAGTFALRVIEAHGFHAWPATTSLSPLGTIFGHNLGFTGDGLLLLGGADFLVWPLGVTAAFIMLHIVGVALGACGIALAAWRFPRERDLVAQVLLAGIVINLAAYLAGTHATGLANTREISAVLPFGAALAGRLLGPPLASRATAGHRFTRVVAPALVVVLLGYLAGLGYELSKPAVPVQAQPIASWLEAHHLTDGLSGFWPSNSVTLATGDRLRIRPVELDGRRLYPFHDLQDSQWYNPASATANFVVLYPGAASYPGGVPGDGPFEDLQAVLATFGKPAATYRVGSATVLVWHKNLLAGLG
jgi:hypothetical protein